MRTRILKYGIATMVGAMLATLYLTLNDYAGVTTDVDRYYHLSNAFTIPGVILVLSGVLVILSNEGAFQTIGYLMKHAVQMLIPGTGKDPERFSDYVARKQENGKTSGFGFLFIVGGIFIAVSVVFIILFYSARG